MKSWIVYFLFWIASCCQLMSVQVEIRDWIIIFPNKNNPTASLTLLNQININRRQYLPLYLPCLRTRQPIIVAAAIKGEKQSEHCDLHSNLGMQKNAWSHKWPLSLSHFLSVLLILLFLAASNLYPPSESDTCPPLTVYSPVHGGEISSVRYVLPQPFLEMLENYFAR